MFRAWGAKFSSSSTSEAHLAGQLCRPHVPALGMSPSTLTRCSARPEDARRRAGGLRRQAAGRSLQNRGPGPPAQGDGQPGAAHQQHRKVWRACRRGRQCVCDRQPRRAGPGLHLLQRSGCARQTPATCTHACTLVPWVPMGAEPAPPTAWHSCTWQQLFRSVLATASQPHPSAGCWCLAAVCCVGRSQP